MFRKSLLSVVLLGSLAAFAVEKEPPSEKATTRIQQEVRHQIVMLPYLDVFDHIAYKVDGYNVTLMGKVTRPTLKSDAERVVGRIEGVQVVNNRIEVLPPSPNDYGLRIKLYRAIYGFAPLQRYAMPVIKPIRIVVDRGHVTLEGLVDSEADRNMATIRASGVAGVFSVSNNLTVAAKSPAKV